MLIARVAVKLVPMQPDLLEDADCANQGEDTVYQNAEAKAYAIDCCILELYAYQPLGTGMVIG